MGQRKGWSVAACLLTAALVAGATFDASGEEPIPPSTNPAAGKAALQDLRSGEGQNALKSGEELYKRGEYTLAAERLQTAVSNDPNNPEALLFLGLAQLRLDDPAKAAEVWGKLQQVSKDERLAQDVGRMRTILLREASERAARDAVAQEQRRLGQRTDPRTVAVATFRNVGTPQYAPLGKALAAMLIDNLSALPGIKVLEREEVEALEQEAKLSATGLVEKGTAVRVGKLLRAGRVTAGSHADWTASPTHLRLDALLVDVDAGTTLTAAQSQAQAEEFFRLVPSVTTTFAAALNQPVSTMSAEVKQKVQEEHTHSLQATLGFGKALDGLDRHDAQAALEACKEVEKADPNFKLAKKKCAFVPLTWLSTQAVASAMEPTAFAMAGAEATSSYLVPGIVGALVVGGIAGGTYAAVHNGGGGGGNKGGGSGLSGNNPPQLNGVSDRTVAAGATAAIDMECRDPDGTATTITNPVAGPGGSFTQTSGNPSKGQYRQPTNGNEIGQSFGVRFTCTDSGSPPASTSQDATIRIVPQQQPTPTPTPVSRTGPPTTATFTPTPTVPPCVPLLGNCTTTFTAAPVPCCAGSCDPTLNVCCVRPTGSCTTSGDCCPQGNVQSNCQANRCCGPTGSPCPGFNGIADDPNCCSGVCYFGACQ